MVARVEQGLRPVRNGLVGAAEAEARELAALLERTVAAREAAVRDAAERAVTWSQTLEQFDEALLELHTLTK